MELKMSVEVETLEDLAALTAAYVREGITFKAYFDAARSAFGRTVYVVELTGGF